MGRLDFEALQELRRRPDGPALLFQRWRSLSFFHRRVEAGLVQSLLPSGLTVQTFPDQSGTESAWVGFVPFRMEGIRFKGTPSVPGLSAFPETNVRTYVTDSEGRPGVWFFSLDATNLPAVQFARRFYGLNYIWSMMSVDDSGSEKRYRAHRRSDSKVGYEVRVTPSGNPAPAEPGSFEFWLVERYLLFAEHRGRIRSGRVFHPPYQVQPVSHHAIVENLVAAAGLGVGSAWDHICYSSGVDVEVFGLD